MFRLSDTAPSGTDLLLRAYLLGTVEFDAALRLQRRLQFEIGSQRSQGALILCEHPPLVSVGRQGSHAHIRWEEAARTERCPVRWVNRGGGCILHLPGQLAIYAVFPLNRLGLDIAAYLDRLSQACRGAITDYSLRRPACADQTGVWVGDRLVAVLGVSVRDWVSSFGAYLNVQPALGPYRLVRTIPHRRDALTSLERERRGPVRPSQVRRRLVDEIQRVFGFSHVSVFTSHPALRRPESRPSRTADRLAVTDCA
jgi:lipoyl(octanoyl) transferase